MHYKPEGVGSWFNLPRQGGVGFASQESWILNNTIRVSNHWFCTCRFLKTSLQDNIIFEGPYDEPRYKKVIYQCGLERDLDLFEAGDLTEVGEKGLTLRRVRCCMFMFKDFDGSSIAGAKKRASRSLELCTRRRQF
jgi:hypothetical protein